QRLVLALHATQLVRERDVALLQHRVGQRWSAVHREGALHAREQAEYAQQPDHTQHAAHAEQARQCGREAADSLQKPVLLPAGAPPMRARNSRRQTSSVITPTCLYTTVPLGLTKKLSGAP